MGGRPGQRIPPAVLNALAGGTVGPAAAVFGAGPAPGALAHGRDAGWRVAGAPPPAGGRGLRVLCVVTTSALRDRLSGRLPGRSTGGSAGARSAGAGGARPLFVAGVSAACGAAGIGLAVLTILVVVGWVAAPHPGIGLIGVLRTAAVLWLVGHHVTVQVSGAGRIGMLPLGLVLLPALLLRRAGRSLVKSHQVSGLRQVLAVALSVAVPYALLAGALALASRSRLAAASLPQAVLAAFCIALVAAGFGAARALAPWAQLGALMSPRSRSVLAGTAGSLAVLIGAGATATALALAGDVHKFGAVYRLLDPGVVGAVLLLLAQLAYLPNAVLWVIAYMLGPGFAVGTGTVVAPTGSVIGALPAFPLLAALPGGGHGTGPAWLAAVLLALPYLAGLVGGLMVARLAPTAVLEAAPIRGFCCGALTGLALGGLTAFAGGPLGDGRMAAVGPSAWQVATVAALEVGIAAAITAGAANWLHVRRHWSPEAGLAVPAGAPRSGRAPAGASRFGRASGGVGSVPGLTETGPNVIYLDRWADDEEPAATAPRPAGPSALP